MQKSAKNCPNLQVLFVLGGVFIVFILASCSPSPVNRTWVYGDLRAIGNLDAPTPATDMVAVYTHTTYLTDDIRVDLLDINPGDKYEVKISLWDNRLFITDPLVINISSTGTVTMSGNHTGEPDIRPRVIQNDDLDTIVVSINRAFIGTRFTLDIDSYTTEPLTLADQILNVRSDGQPPVRRAPVLFAFWNTFPVTTPTQALRRWDGAHAGPLGTRHGLTNILDAVEHTWVPITLLDIKNPASLAALNFMGNISQFQFLYDHGLLTLPDVAYGQPADVALQLSRSASAQFGLPNSQFVYDPASSALSQTGKNSFKNYLGRFMPLPDTTHLALSNGMRLIPLPEADAIQATTDGPSLDVRRALINAALSPDPTDLVVLGGSVPDSTWGNFDMAAASIGWIAAHPWIYALTGNDLLAFPTASHKIVFDPVQADAPWLQALRSAISNPITQSAWQTYLTLSAPTENEQLQALRSAYLGQIGELLSASNWSKQPTSHAECNQDLNSDGQDECILANKNYFAVFELAGARLTQLFSIDATGSHQWIGPSSQFTVGLSDPSEWSPNMGEAADPSVIPGAFTDDTETWSIYTPAVNGDQITFTSPDGKRVKTYQLTANGIQVRYRTESEVSTRIPLAVDPQVFYSGPAEYTPALTSHSWSWSLTEGFGVEVKTDANLTAEAITDSLPFISSLEDPNRDYPSGDYLPFPLSLVTIQSSGDFSVQITHK